MIDYYKVYQSIDDNILKNAIEVIKPNELLIILYSILDFVGACLILLITCRTIIFFIEMISQKDDKEELFFKILLKNMKHFFILFLGLGLNSSFILVQNNKYKEYSKNIEINNSIKTQKELFSNVMGNKNPKEFLEQGKKLEKFCSFYYSPTDSNFCKDNKINKYTFNLVFSKIYGTNEDKTIDLEKALKYIKEENSND
jgi:hypothetical protein